MDFSKYEATGNDFILVDGTTGPVRIPASFIRSICRRRTGIGADGLIVISASPGYDLQMRIFNADGTEAEMCGNGLRALALFAMDRGLVRAQDIEVDTLAGPRKVRFAGDRGGEKLFTVDMGSPSFRRPEIPMLGGEEENTLSVVLEVGEGNPVEATCLSMGNPHCVIFVHDIEHCPVGVLGSQIENHPLFPRRTNVEFVHMIDPEHLGVRVWERGAGETLSCGTGACASLVAARLKGYVEGGALVSVPGGDLRVEWEGGKVRLQGPARHVFDGTISEVG